MKNIIEDYINLKQNINFLIQKSGFKNVFLAQKLGMSPVTFSMKKKRNNWTEDELEKILDLIENEELEGYYLAKLIEQKKDEETISLTELKNELN